jgi:hypothetical protein
MQNILKLAKGWLKVGTKKKLWNKSKKRLAPNRNKNSFGTRARELNTIGNVPLKL